MNIIFCSEFNDFAHYKYLFYGNNCAKDISSNFIRCDEIKLPEHIVNSVGFVFDLNLINILHGASFVDFLASVKRGHSSQFVAADLSSSIKL